MQQVREAMRQPSQPQQRRCGFKGPRAYLHRLHYADLNHLICSILIVTNMSRSFMLIPPRYGLHPTIDSRRNLDRLFCVLGGRARLCIASRCQRSSSRWRPAPRVRLPDSTACGGPLWRGSARAEPQCSRIDATLRCRCALLIDSYALSQCGPRVCADAQSGSATRTSATGRSGGSKKRSEECTEV